MSGEIFAYRLVIHLKEILSTFVWLTFGKTFGLQGESKMLINFEKGRSLADEIKVSKTVNFIFLHNSTVYKTRKNYRQAKSFFEMVQKFDYSQTLK